METLALLLVLMLPLLMPAAVWLAISLAHRRNPLV